MSNFKAPQGYSKASTDIVGTYDPKVQPNIHFTPYGVNLSDSQADKNKISCLVFATLVEDCLLADSKGEDGNRGTIQGKAGDTVGIWYKPGMRPITKLCGSKVFMYPNGERDTGKMNPMKLFEILKDKDGTPIPVLDDFREKTARLDCDFAKGTQQTRRLNTSLDSSVPENSSDSFFS